MYQLSHRAERNITDIFRVFLVLFPVKQQQNMRSEVNACLIRPLCENCPKTNFFSSEYGKKRTKENSEFGQFSHIDYCGRQLILRQRIYEFSFPADRGRKLNVHKTFRRRPGRLLNVLCTFSLRPVSTGLAQLE